MRQRLRPGAEKNRPEVSVASKDQAGIEVVWGTALLDRLATRARGLGVIASSVLLFAVYVVGAEACHVFVIPPSQSAVAWLPSGLNFALFVRARRIPALWPGWLAALWLGQFVVVRYNDGLPMVTAILWSTANVVVPLTAALLARRYVADPFTMRRLRDIVLLGAMIVVSVLPGALLGAAGAVLGLGAPSIARFALTWGSSDALGIIVLAPVVLTWTAEHPKPAGRALEAISLLAGMTLVSAIVFLRSEPTLLDLSLFALLSLFVAWASIRFGPRATTIVVLLVDMVMVGATVNGLGPFARSGLGPEAQLLNLQVLVATLALLTLLLAAAIEEQRVARAAAEASHGRAQLLLAERAQAEARLRLANAELGALTEELHASKEEERRHIVQELHDGLGQVLTAAKISLHIARKGETPDKSQPRIDEAVRFIDQCIDSVRDLSRGMRPALLDEDGLLPALQAFLEEQRRHSGLTLTLRAPPALRRLPPATEVALFRIVQESLTNVLRHARAVQVVVTIDTTQDSLEASVRDDGQGFDVDAVMGKTLAAQHLGLVGMRERARSIGADFSITSTLGRGAQVSVRLPMSAAGGNPSA
jgi:signal transduction histidine kinase